jgi:hypothetical protein
VGTISGGSSPQIAGKIQEATSLDLNTDCRQANTYDSWAQLRDGTNSNIQFAAAFTTSAGETPTMYRVQWRLHQDGTIAAGAKMWLELQGDSTNDPDDTPVQTSYYYECADVTTDAAGGGELFTFEFPIPYALTASTTYHIVLQADYAVSSTNCIAVGYDTVGSGGNFSYYDSAWAQTATIDIEMYSWDLTWADISGATFTDYDATIYGNTALTDTEYFEVVEVNTANNGPYLVYVGTITGSPTYIEHGAIAVLGDKLTLDT